MEAHPGIVFRDGPSGRRAGLAAGPDVWEVVGLLRGLSGSVEERVTAAAGQPQRPAMGTASMPSARRRRCRPVWNTTPPANCSGGI